MIQSARTPARCQARVKRASSARQARVGPQLALRDRMQEKEGTPSAADHIGQAAGGITGVVAGAAIGVTAGPLGILLGGIAGAIGGWWTGRAVAEAAEDITEADEAYYRTDFDRATQAATPAPFEEARRAYYLGHLAASAYDGK